MKFPKIIVLIFCFIYSLNSKESDQWSIIQYTSDNYPKINYFELNKGSISCIYIDTPQKRMEQKKRFEFLQNSEFYPFIQKNPQILFHALGSFDFNDKLSQVLSEVQLNFISIEYSEVETPLSDLIPYKHRIEQIKCCYPDILNSLLEDGTEKLICDIDNGKFPPENSYGFYYMIPMNLGAKTLAETFEKFRKMVLEYSNLHQNVLGKDISYDEMKNLMKDQFGIDEISVYYITSPLLQFL